MNVSLILLTYNAGPLFEENLDRILSQDFEGDVEIIFMDSSSTDSTPELIKERGFEVTSLPTHEFHHARTRNMAAEKAAYECLVFLSQDALPADDHWLKNLVRPFEDSRVGAVYGRQIPPEGTGALRSRALESVYPAEREVRSIPASGKLSLGTIRFSNANSAVRTDIWRRFRFSEDILVAEDRWLCYQILKNSMSVVYEPSAAVVHGHERSLLGEFKWAVDIGLSVKRMGFFDDPDAGSDMAYGIRCVKEDWRHFASSRMYFSGMKSIAVSAAKWLGVQVGKREKYIPRWLMKCLSMNMKHLENGPPQT